MHSIPIASALHHSAFARWHAFRHVPCMIHPLLALLSLFAVLAPQGDALAQKPLRTIPQTAFSEGERLKFRIHYGIITAGRAELGIDEKRVMVAGHPTYHIVAEGRSVSSFDWFFKVRDKYESFLDVNSLVPWLFLRNVNEGGYKTNQVVKFDHLAHKAVSNTATKRTPDGVQDLVSAFYYARNMDLSNLKVGQTINIPVFLDDSVHLMRMKFAGTEVISTDLGRFRCQIYKPQLLQGRVFKGEDDMKLWVTDDANHIPVLARAEIVVGSISMTITDVKGLRYPLTSRVQ